MARGAKNGRDNKRNTTTASQDITAASQNLEAEPETEVFTSSRKGPDRGKMSAELKKQAPALVCTAILLVLCLVALLAPNMGIKAGTMLGGFNEVPLSVTAADGSVPSSEDIEHILPNMKARARGLYERGVEVVRIDDTHLGVRVPFAYDAETVAGELVGGGKLELVRIDDISDADVLAQIKGNAKNIPLKEGTYTSFASNSDVTDARVITNTLSAQLAPSAAPNYGIGLTLGSEGTKQLRDVSSQLAATSNGKIAIVLDGTVLATPSVSKVIDEGKFTISGGFTREEAYALASKISAGPLTNTLTAQDSVAYPSVFGEHPRLYLAAGIVLLAILMGVVGRFIIGRTSWMLPCALITTIGLQLGVMAILARFDYLIMGTPDMVSIIIAALISVVACLYASTRYRGARNSDVSVRKAQQLASSRGFGRVAIIEAVLCCASIVCSFFVTGLFHELAWASAAGFFADLLTIPLIDIPLLRVLTVRDIVRTSSVVHVDDVADVSQVKE